VGNQVMATSSAQMRHSELHTPFPLWSAAMAMALALSLPSSRRLGSVVHAHIEHRGWTSDISHSMVSSPTFATEPRHASAVLGHVVGEAHRRGARPVICFDVHDGWLP